MDGGEYCKSSGGSKLFWRVSSPYISLFNADVQATFQETKGKMGFDQYHEPASELSQETRTFARMIAGMIEEAEAINWYEQRMSVEKDKEAKAIMEDAQEEEFKHFGMDLEFLLRKKTEWRKILKKILFTQGDIVKRGEEAEKAAK